MGRLSKIKRGLVLEANKRLLNEVAAGFECRSQCYCHLSGGQTSPTGWNPNGPYTTMADCWNDNSNCCSDTAYGVRLKLCNSGTVSDVNLWGLLNSSNVGPGDVGTQVSINVTSTQLMGIIGLGVAGDICCTIESVFIWEPLYGVYQPRLKMHRDPDCCPYEGNYRCKGPVQQATAIRERANFDNTSSCVEDPNGEFKSLQDCQENCESGYGPGFEPDIGTTEG